MFPGGLLPGAMNDGSPCWFMPVNATMSGNRKSLKGGIQNPGADKKQTQAIYRN